MKTQEERKTAIMQKYNEMHEDSPITKALVEEILNLESEDILSDLQETGKTKIPGAGAVEVRYVKEKNGRNPQNGETITIPEHLKLALKPSAKVRSVIESIDIAPYKEAATK